MIREVSLSLSKYLTLLYSPLWCGWPSVPVMRMPEDCGLALGDYGGDLTKHHNNTWLSPNQGGPMWLTGREHTQHGHTNPGMTQVMGRMEQITQDFIRLWWPAHNLKHKLCISGILLRLLIFRSGLAKGNRILRNETAEKGGCCRVRLTSKAPRALDGCVSAWVSLKEQRSCTPASPPGRAQRCALKAAPGKLALGDTTFCFFLNCGVFFFFS